jgi:hypothetical protein
MRKDTAVEACADFCHGYLNIEPPSISAKLANAMGLHRLPNLKIQKYVNDPFAKEPQTSRLSLIKKYKTDILGKVQSLNKKRQS